MGLLGPEVVVLIVVVVVSILGKNDLVVAAGGLLLVMKFTRLNTMFPFLSERGIELGILLLTISVLTPFASGEIMPRDLLNTLKSPAGMVAIFFRHYCFLLDWPRYTFITN